jgi:hypothetical protein
LDQSEDSLPPSTADVPKRKANGLHTKVARFKKHKFTPTSLSPRPFPEKKSNQRPGKKKKIADSEKSFSGSYKPKFLDGVAIGRRLTRSAHGRARASTADNEEGHPLVSELLLHTGGLKTIDLFNEVINFRGGVSKKDVIEHNAMDHNGGWIAGLQLETKPHCCGGVDSTFDFPIGSVGHRTCNGKRVKAIACCSKDAASRAAMFEGLCKRDEGKWIKHVLANELSMAVSLREHRETRVWAIVCVFDNSLWIASPKDGAKRMKLLKL